MLGDPRFVKASYALFAVAVLAVFLKLGGITDAKPAILQMAPAEPAAAVAKPAPRPIESRVPDGPLLDWPEEGDLETRPLSDFALGGRLEGRAEPATLAQDAPVFRRPSPEGKTSEPVCGDLGAFPESSRVVFPLPDEYLGSYEAGWGSPRPQGGHEGADLMSPAGTPEFAVTDGTIVEVAGANENGWNRLGGYTVMLEAAYDVGPIRSGDLFYYAHLDERSSLPIGTEVRAGQQVGVVGDTGEGPEGTRGEFPSHLHLGWYDAGEARSEVESGAMDPYPLLLWLESNGGAVSGGTDASYCEAPQGPVPASASPGERPDMDTGNEGDARPSPVVENDEPRDRPSDKKSGKQDGGRAGKPDPGKSKAVVVAIPAPEDPVDAPDRTTKPVEGGEPRGGIGNLPEPSPEPPPFDRAPLPAPEAPEEEPETTVPDGREDDEDAGGKDRNPPKADETNPDGEDDREERPDAESPEPRPEPVDKPEDGAVPNEENPDGDADREEDPRESTGPPAPAKSLQDVPMEPEASPSATPGEAGGG